MVVYKSSFGVCNFFGWSSYYYFAYIVRSKPDLMNYGPHKKDRLDLLEIGGETGQSTQMEFS